MKKKKQLKQITPDEMRMVIRAHLSAKGITAAEFFREHATLWEVKQRTFEMFVMSNKLKGAKCLIPAYELITNKVIIKTGSARHGGVKYFIQQKESITI